MSNPSYIYGPDEEAESEVAITNGRPSNFHIGSYPTQMFIELQELVPRVEGGLVFDEAIFCIPVAAHFKVLWLETARWVNFEENFNELEQRFTEAHVSPMKFTCIKQFQEYMNEHLSIISTDACTLGQALEEVARLAMSKDCIQSMEQYDVLRAILFAERWHPDVKGHISDAAEFDRYWAGTAPEVINPMSISGRDQHRRALSRALSIHHEREHPYHRFNQPLTNCLLPTAEACTVVCGTIEFLKKPMMVLLQLNSTIRQSCVTEVDVPVRFIFLFIGPDEGTVNYAELARIFAVMMTNHSFRSCIYDAQTPKDVFKATELFMQESLVIPLSRHSNVMALAGMVRHIEAYRRDAGYERDPDRPRKSIISSRKQSHLEMGNILGPAHKQASFSTKPKEIIDRTDGDLVKEAPTISKKQRYLQDFCPPFVDLARGIRPWLRRIPSDYKDAFDKENIGTVIGSVLFLYFVNLSPSITFAALLNTQVDPSYTVTLTLLSVGIYLVMFTALAGQPLAVIGVSAPMFIVESSLVSVAKAAMVDTKQLRFWVAIYASLFGLGFIAANISAVANHIRRSVEEIYNSFIGFFFLLKSLFTMFLLIPSRPKGTTLEAQVDYRRRLAIAGSTLFLAFIMLQFCLLLAQIKRGNYLRRTIRKLLGALNVPLGMLLITAMERIFFRGVELPKVNIPLSNEINVSTWVNPPDLAKVAVYANSSPGMIHGMGIAVGMALAVILFTEASLNGITAMKNKAVKPNIFVMDLVLLQVLFPIISGFTGWPFVSGATVRTLSNLVALVKMDQSPAPGMPHRIIGTVEQRVSGIIVGVLVALSIFLGSVLSFIPLAALYGMFLYMGVMGLRDLQFVLRIFSLMKRRKHWADWECVRGLPSRHILVFALIQAFVIGILVALNVLSDFTTANYVGILFPLVILIYGMIREFALPKWKWLAVYLHHLDRKYKLNPVTVRKSISATRNLSLLPKESRTSFASAMNVTSQLKANSIDVDRVLDPDTESSSEFSEHEDGVVRQTWAT